MRHFKDKYGRQVDPISPIFPILTGDKNSKTYKLLGTGFYVNTFGGFLTAKHVLYDQEGNHISPFFAITTHNDNHYTRYLYQSFPHPTADICYGLLRRDAHLGNKYLNFDFQTPVMQILENEPQPGDTIQTFAYPNSKLEYEGGEQWGTFQGDWFDGKILDILPYRDKTFYPYKVIESDMQVLGGASGGPVMKGAYVIGVNSSGYDLEEAGSSLSYITPIKFAHEIEVEIKRNKFKLGDNRIKTIRDL